jgi:hypothetical protein
MTNKKPKTIAQLAILSQPTPKPNNYQPCFVQSVSWLLGKECDDLIDGIESRKDLGLERYNVYLQMQNGRCPIVDAFQEGIDMMLYLNQEYQEKFPKTQDEGAVSQAELDEIVKDFYAIAEVSGRIAKRLRIKYGIDT